VLQVPVPTELQALLVLLVHWERQVLPALALTEQVELQEPPVLRALPAQAQQGLLEPLVLRGRQVLLAHPAQSGLLVQALLVLRELALQALLAYKEQRALVLTAQPVQQVLKALLVSKELPELLAPLAQLVLALQAPQAFKDRLALLVLARLATMT
jgi:hypothetical protein